MSRRQDLTKLKKRLERFNVVDYILKQRPDTKWKPLLITNVHFSLFHLNYLLGAPIELPTHIKSSKSIVSLVKDQSSGTPHDDNLCIFRCLSTHLHGSKQLETNTKSYFKKWHAYVNETVQKEEIIMPRCNVEQFDGVSVENMVYFERCFQINVNIFELSADGTAKYVYKSRCHYKDTMNLNMFEHHLSYISRFNTYASKYQCRTCERHFSRINNMLKHQRLCKGQTKYQYPGGLYTAPVTVFDVLEYYNITVPIEERIFPWFIVYDFEAMLLPVHEGGNKLSWTSKHVPISVSVCSNVEGYTDPHCIVDSDVDTLVRSMVDYMQEIAKMGDLLAREKFKVVFDELDEMIDNPEESISISHSTFTSSQALAHQKSLKGVREKLEAYCQQMICLGFNSSKYDMNLIKSHLAMHLNIDKESCFTVKRNNQYACLSNKTLKFLDITSYLSPGINYSKFLKAYDVNEDKGFFCYEWFDDVTKLDHQSLPPHAAFYPP